MSASVRVSPASLACVNSRQNKVPQHRLRAMASSSLVRPSIWAGLVSDHLIFRQFQLPPLVLLPVRLGRLLGDQLVQHVRQAVDQEALRIWVLLAQPQPSHRVPGSMSRGSAMYLSSLQCGRQLSATSSGVRPKTPLSLPTVPPNPSAAATIWCTGWSIPSCRCKN